MPLRCSPSSSFSSIPSCRSRTRQAVMDRPNHSSGRRNQYRVHHRVPNVGITYRRTDLPYDYYMSKAAPTVGFPLTPTATDDPRCCWLPVNLNCSSRSYGAQRITMASTMVISGIYVRTTARLGPVSSIGIPKPIRPTTTSTSGIYQTKRAVGPGPLIGPEPGQPAAERHDRDAEERNRGRAQARSFQCLRTQNTQVQAKMKIGGVPNKEFALPRLDR